MPGEEVEKAESDYLNVLVDSHWNYIEGVYNHANPFIDELYLQELEFTYKTAMKHGWRHAKEYYTGSV